MAVGTQQSEDDTQMKHAQAQEESEAVAELKAGDDVDTIVTEWEVQRPDFDARSLAIFSRLLRLDRHIDHIRREVFSKYGIERWQFEMLTELRRRPDGHKLTAGQLMDKTLVSSGTITNRIDRLEEQGLVRRIADPNDKRVVIVQATDKGIALADNAMISLLDKQRELLKPYSEEEIAAVTSFLRSMLSDLDASVREPVRRL